MNLLRLRVSLVLGVVGLTLVILASGCSKGNGEENLNPTASPSPAATSSLPASPKSSSGEPSIVPAPSLAPTDGAPVTAAPTATSDATPLPSKDVEPEPSEEPKTPVISPEPSPADTQKIEAIENKYEFKFSSIRSSCQAKVSNLTGEVTSYIAGAKSGDGEVSISDLQKKFLGKVAAAEGSCDQLFNSTLAQAEQAYKDAGVVDTKIAAWKSEYNSGKAQARLAAMSKILAAWQAE
ncbi:hypothetical protein COHCIP112018_04285 [Cohnella sp. JJ-181]|nr:hypothetical protein COHCIP112018_04285 [Cohnella sp. JJ-181]